MLKNIFATTFLCVSLFCMSMAPISLKTLQQTGRYANRLWNRLYPRRTYSQQPPSPGLSEVEIKDLSKLMKEERTIGEERYALRRKITEQKDDIASASYILQLREPTLNLSHIVHTPPKKSWFEWLTGKPSCFDTRRYKMNIDRQELARKKAIKAHEDAVFAHKKAREEAIATIQKSTNALKALTKSEAAAWNKQYKLIQQLEKYGIK
jgi:hypothetical protein